MKEFLAMLVMCVGFLYMIEGIDKAVTTKRTVLTNNIRIGYPAYVVIVMIYFLALGLFK